jgi:hypothetical protein
MKKIAVLAFICTLTLAYAQVSETEKPAVPASQEDVREVQKELQKEIQRLRAEGFKARKAAADIADREAEERKKMVKENALALERAEAKLESISREARKASDDQLRRQRIVWYFTGAVVFIGVIFLAWFLKKNRAEKIQQAIPGGLQKKQEILIDPDIPALKEFSARNNDTEKVPFILSLRDGQQFNCVAELKDGLTPLVYIEKETIPVAWDKRRQRAAKLAAPNTAV